jgi:diguanylate cyclase (GGDEF)-like protein
MPPVDPTFPDEMGNRGDSVRAARRAAALFASYGALTLASLAHPAWRGPSLLVVGLADVLAAALAFGLPWRRWPRQATVALAVLAFALVAASQVAGAVPPRAYGVFFVLVFAWVGMHHAPGTAVTLVPVGAAAYVVPLVVAGPVEPPFDVRAALVTLVLCVLVAETIARSTRAAAVERSRSERAAQSFRVVSETSTRLRLPDPESVLDAVVSGVRDLGWDGANLAVADPGGDTFEVVHARGLARRYAGRHRLSDGLTGRVRANGELVVVHDYQQWDSAIPAILRTGIRTCVGVPVFVAGELTGVLVAASVARRALQAEDLDALRLLAATAGVAIEQARRFQAEQASARRLKHASLTDELTGLGNRRLGHQLLSALRPGDAVALLDLDNFKMVNDSFGHAVGDRVLVDLSRHLRQALRASDRVARFGGEEFLVVLPRTDVAGAAAILDRLRHTWAEQYPLTTFSVGVAPYERDGADVTLARADRALYAAKAGGRNRVATAVAEDRRAVAQ